MSQQGREREKKGRNIYINEPKSFSLAEMRSIFHLQHTRESHQRRKLSVFCWPLCAESDVYASKWNCSRFYTMPFFMFRFVPRNARRNFSFSLLLSSVCAALQMTQWNIIKYVTSSPTRPRHKQSEQSGICRSAFLIFNINFICWRMTTKLKK